MVVMSGERDAAAIGSPKAARTASIEAGMTYWVRQTPAAFGAGAMVFGLVALVAWAGGLLR